MTSARLFWRDLLKAARAWRAAPALPVVSVLVVLPLEASSIVPGRQGAAIELVAGTAFLLFGIGWVGTQRIWYLRIFNGATLTASEVWDLTRRFFGRYFVLGVWTGTPIFAFLFGYLFWQIRTQAPPHREPVWVLISFLLYFFSLDVVLTFVTPALAYTTSRVTEAWKIGIDMLRNTWPSCGVYAFLPPLTLLALGTINPAGLRAEVAVVTSVMSALIGLLTKGAIASFYLERMPASEVASTGGGPDVGATQSL